MNIFHNQSKSQSVRRAALQLEALEARDVPSASPMLMAPPGQDIQQSQSLATSPPIAQQDSFYGRGVYKSTDSGQTWTLHAPSPIGGNESLTIGINHALSDLGQWRQRFGSGL